MTGQSHHRRLLAVYRVAGFVDTHTRLDWVAGVLVSLLVGVQLAAVSLATAGMQTGTLSPEMRPDAAADPMSGVMMAGIFVVEGALILGLGYLWDRLPERVRKILAWGIVLSLWLLLASTLTRPGLAVYIAGTLAMIAVGRLDLYWLAASLVGLMFATVAGMVAGYVLAPAAMLTICGLFAIVDYVEVSQSSWMQRLAGRLLDAGMPAVVVIPRALRIPWEDITDLMDGDSSDRVEMVVGNGDLAFPAMLAVTSAVHVDAASVFGPLSWPTLGVLTGTAIGAVAIRAALDREDRARPGLPWLLGPALAGYGLGALFAGVPLQAVGLTGVIG